MPEKTRKWYDGGGQGSTKERCLRLTVMAVNIKRNNEGSTLWGQSAISLLELRRCVLLLTVQKAWKFRAVRSDLEVHTCELRGQQYFTTLTLRSWTDPHDSPNINFNDGQLMIKKRLLDCPFEICGWLLDRHGRGACRLFQGTPSLSRLDWLDVTQTASLGNYYSYIMNWK